MRGMKFRVIQAHTDGVGVNILCELVAGPQAWRYMRASLFMAAKAWEMEGSELTSSSTDSDKKRPFLKSYTMGRSLAAKFSYSRVNESHEISKVGTCIVKILYLQTG